MTIRRGGSPRDDGSQAHPLEPGSYDDAATASRAFERELDRRRELRRRMNGDGGGHHILRFLLFALVLGALVLVGLVTVARPLITGVVTSWAYDNPGALRIPFVEAIVREQLGAALTTAPSSDSSTVTFEVLTGDTPPALAPRLAQAGLISDQRAFIFEATLGDLTPKLKAGSFELRRNMTPAEIVVGLVQNRVVVTVVPLTFREGLRIEQMTALLEKKIADGEAIHVDPKAFYDEATKPPASLLADYPWLADAGLPKGASLEGFLAPATYQIVEGTTADDLIRQMLDKFAESVGTDRMTVPASRGLTFYQVLTLASIVEREAVLDEERPLIAGVYQNHLSGKGSVQLLGADPTVFYALDTMALRNLAFDQWPTFAFWQPRSGLNAAQVTPDLAGYQTYQSRGLPPGPICTPTVASIDAALEPDTKDKYLYFVAIPNGGGAHDFSKTLAEHEQKLHKYGYT